MAPETPPGLDGDTPLGARDAGDPDALALEPLGPDSFDAFLAANERAIVEFGAHWCDACNELAGDLDDLARDTGVAVGTVDIEAHPAVLASTQSYLRGLVARRIHPMLTVRAIPTVMVYEDGDRVQHHQGLSARTVLTYGR